MAQFVQAQPKRGNYTSLIWISIVVAFFAVVRAASESVDFHWTGAPLGKGLVVTNLAASGAAKAAGLEIGDRIIAVEDTLVHTRNHFMFVKRRFKAGQAYELTVQHPDGTSSQHKITGKPEDNLLTMLILPLIGVAFLSIGSIVYLFQFNDEASLIFFLTSTAFAFSYGVAYARTPVLSLLENAGFLAASFVVHFFLVFPVRHRCASRPWALALLYLPGFVLLLLSFSMTLGVFRIDLFDTRSFIESYQMAGAGFGLSILIYTAFTCKQARIRQQIKWIIWGLAVAVLANVAFKLVETIWPLRGLLDINIVNWITLIVPLSFAFSLIRYRLFDIDTVINRSVVFIILAVVATIVYLIFIQTLPTLNIHIEYSNPIMITILVVVLGIALEPFRQLVQKMVDRVMYWRRPNYRQVLQDMSREIVSSIDLDQSLNLVLDYLHRVTQCECAQIFLYRTQDDHYYCADALGAIQQADPISTGHLLVEALKTGQEVLCMPDINESSPTPRTVSDIEQFMQRESLILCLPLRSHNRLLGWVGLGAGQKGRLYSLDERRFLSTLTDQAAVAIQNALLYQESQDQTRQLTILYEVDKILTSTLNLDDLLRHFLSHLVETFSVETASVLLVDHVRENLVFRSACGSGDDILPGVPVPLNSRSIAALVADTGKPILLNDAQSDPRWYPVIDQLTHFTTEQLVCVPILHRDSVTGVIQIVNRCDHKPFTAWDLNTLTLLSGQASMAIENARLYASTDQALAERLQELAMMQEIDRLLNATLDFEHVMSLTLEWAMRVTQADMGFIGLIVEQNECDGISITAKQGYPFPPGQLEQSIWPVGEGILGQAVAKAQSINSSDVALCDDYVPIHEATRSKLVVPVMREGRVISVINLESATLSRFDEQDEAFVTRLADHAAIAIENAHLYQKIKLANESKSEFVSIASHELKAPMAVIKGYSELLGITLEDKIDAEQRKLIDTIISSTERMKYLIDELLQMARLESGTIRLDRYPVNIHTIFAQAITSFRHMIRERGIAVSLNVSSDLPRVYADPHRLDQIVTNLLSNAIKYTPQGKTVEISACLCADNRQDQVEMKEFVRCDVKDSGIGISEQDQCNLFAKFFRANHPHVRKQPGTGLGLSITKMLVELHDGKIGVDSELERGSTFWFTIPAVSHDH
ncbi:MAG: GAF domain-containing protein [Anaerolineae bacterium]|nr:GAF domain-containing protein [Anaerolineae bacterium]